MGRRATGAARAGRRATVAARGQPRVLRGAGRARATSSPTTTSRTGSSAATTSCACRPGTARRSSGSASTSPTMRKQVRRFQRRWERAAAQLAVRALPQPLRDADPAPRVRDRGRDARDRLPARSTCSRGPTATRRRARSRARLGLPEGKRTVLYAPTYRDHVQRPPRPLPAGPAPRPRAPAGSRGRGHRGPLPQAPLRRRPRARPPPTASCATSRAIPTAPS